MATAYAHAVRQRALMLPWDMRFGTGTQYEQCPALTAVWHLLRAVDQFPEEHWNRNYGGSCCNLCFLCKLRNINETHRSLSYCCHACTSRLATFSASDRQEYFHIYKATLELAHAQWLPPINQTPSLDWMNSYSLAAVREAQLAAIGTNPNLSRLEKLRLSAQIHLTRRTENSLVGKM